MTGVFLRKIIRAMEEIADPSWAYSWDNVGLQLGDKNATIKKILLALDLSQPIVSEAITQNADLIISHHPLFFHPFTSLSFSESPADLIRQLIQNNIAVYSAHTNLDKAYQGSSHLLCEKLGLLADQVLEEEKLPTTDKKMVVFVPPEKAEEVFHAIHSGGGGKIGNYSYCSFQTAGVGTYRPETGATPYTGEVGKIEKANEVRLEAIIPQECVTETIQRVKKVHPYEEVALDIYPLESTTSIGIGRIGNLPRTMILSDWAQEVKKRLGLKTLRLTGDPCSKVDRVAVVAGSGGEFIKAAKRFAAQCLVTGDIRYHQARQAEELGLGMLDVGHYHSERLIVEYLFDKLTFHPHLAGSGLVIQKAELEKDPFLFC